MEGRAGGGETPAPAADATPSSGRTLPPSVAPLDGTCGGAHGAARGEVQADDRGSGAQVPHQVIRLVEVEVLAPGLSVRPVAPLKKQTLTKRIESFVNWATREALTHGLPDQTT
ncbi:hypothetical protein GCM10010365_20920 [Streptomyces poonensis]|uniref:Uncharacterized protein n=1 Tax=Streptomyces poonensis TaxID=68255 RepID=A0A918PDS8_9ACTN|nr:hypothetical protein GCM10010365_20920 [Streptomyces poonensis]